MWVIWWALTGCEPAPQAPAVLAFPVYRVEPAVSADHVAPARCEADLRIDPDGEVLEVVARGCPEPYAGATIAALSRWRFAFVGPILHEAHHETLSVAFSQPNGPRAPGRQVLGWVLPGLEARDSAGPGVAASDLPATAEVVAGTVAAVAEPPPILSDLEVKRRVLPDYPEAAYALGLPPQRCKVFVTIDPEGTPLHSHVDDCDTVFHAAANEAILKWRWYPPKKDGQPTSARTLLFFNFRLEDADVPVDDVDLQVKVRVEPSYPDAARSLGLPHPQKCVVRVIVDRRGVPSHNEVKGCDPVFHTASREAIMKWRWYPPKTKDSQLVIARTAVVFRFMLEEP